MSLRQIASFLIISAIPVFSHASVNARPELSLQARERQLAAVQKRDAEYASVPHTAGREACQLAQPPQAIATPDPLLDRSTPAGSVTVSFIIGTDGRVHSPLILESAGNSEDRVVLETVSSWRFRPATCNGSPTETEATIGFSTR